jgi:predicted lipid-binding transport protein (Tim44 family)
MSSCCGGKSSKETREEREKPQESHAHESGPEHEAHDHGGMGCGMGGGMMKWILIGLLLLIVFSYLR